MKEIWAEAAVMYWQEVDSLLIIAFPAVLAGPIAVVLADSGLIAGVVALPVAVALYVAAFAACVRSAGLVLRHLAPDPRESYRGVLAGAPTLLRMVGPGALLLAGAIAGCILLNDRWSFAFALAPAALGAGGFALWAFNHAYDQPLMLVHDLPAGETAVAGRRLVLADPVWTLRLLAGASAPLAVAGLLSLWLGAASASTLGTALFLLAVGLWLPLPALCVSFASDQLMADWPVRTSLTAEPAARGRW